MRIVITGHTSGLGKAIYDHFTITGEHEVIGLSRSTGHELPAKIDSVISIALTADLFFNNVDSENSQSTLLKHTLNKIRTVTSGSMGADYHTLDNPYYKRKKTLEVAFQYLKKQSTHPMLLLKMGYLENYSDSRSKTIPYKQIINAIDFWIDNPRVTMIEFDNIN
jgi:hypothetical protein